MIKYLISDLENILENREFVNTLKGKVSLGKILFVASDPKKDEMTKMYGERMVNAFKEKEIEFLGVDYVTEATNIEDIKCHLQEYSLIFLMGGLTLVQNEFMVKINLSAILKEYNGIVMGLSAGALNMCENTFESSYHGDDEKTVIIKGLGLVDIVVEVHFDINEDEQIEEIKKTGLKIYAIPNDAAIMFDNDNKMYTYGPVYLCNKDEVINMEK